MITTRIIWQGEAAKVQVKAAAWTNLQKCVVTFHTMLLSALNVANPRPYRTPSQPGEPPRKRTGHGQAGVQYELDEATLSGRVGVTKAVVYMLFLELGTRVMDARPWLLATLKRNLDRLSQIAGGG